MTEQQTIEVQSGVWIRDEWLQHAGLGRQLRVEVLPGEIRLSPAPAHTEDDEPTEAGWEALLRFGEGASPGGVESSSTQPELKVGTARGWAVWRALGESAGPGKYGDMAENHDRYLYGRER